MAFLINVSPPILFFLFLSSIPLAFSLSTLAISQTPNRSLICALVPLSSSPQQHFLNCSSFPSGTQVPIAVDTTTSYSGTVAGDGFVCALGSFAFPSNSTLVCWRFSENGTSSNYRRLHQGQAISELESGNSHICGLFNGTNRLWCWQWPEFNATTITHTFSSIAVGDDFVCGLSEFGQIRCFGGGNNINAPMGNYSSIAAGSTHACAINYADDIHCWGSFAGETPKGKFKSLALADNRSCGLRSNDTVLCWGQNNFSLPEDLRETSFVTIEAKGDAFCGVLTYNYSLYCWGSEIFSSYSKVFDKVLPGPCRSFCRYPLDGSGRFCQPGYSICQNGLTTGNSSSNSPPPVALPPSPIPQQRLNNNKWSNKLIAFLVVGCVGMSVLLLLSGFFLFRYCKKNRGCRVHDSGRLDEEGLSQRVENPQLEQAPRVLEKRLSQLASMGNAGQLEEFSLQELLQVTDNFSESHKIGSGSFGCVYHGTFDDGRRVAIKRAEASSNSTSYAVGGSRRRQEDKDNAFVQELESLSRLHHKNLVRLLGFCEENNELVLVYEFMENGTLHDHLHKLESSPLMNSWPARIKIAVDAARGIDYLHEYAVPPIIHRDIKSSNILLDGAWTAKVSDFGLSLMGPKDDESHLSLRAAGTVGYMDPEYYRLQQLTKKSDVYSFGVVLLEMLSGQKAIHKNENGVPRNVVDYVVPYVVQDEIHRVLDRRVPPPTPFEIEAVAYVGYLAVDCVTLEGRGRPSMSEIVSSLERALAACLVQSASLSRSTTGSST